MSGFDPSRCAHKIFSNRVVGMGRVAAFCTACGLELGTRSTWEDQDTATQAFNRDRDRRRESALVARAEQKENMSNRSPGRRFTCTKGSSNKFWQVWREGRDHVVLFGAIGSTGQTRRKKHMSVAAANRCIALKIREKTNKGYVEDRESVSDPFYAGYDDPRPEPKKRRDQSAAAKKAWETRRNREAAEKKAAEAKKNAEPKGFLRPRRVPKVNP